MFLLILSPVHPLRLLCPSADPTLPSLPAVSAVPAVPAASASPQSILESSSKELKKSGARRGNVLSSPSPPVRVPTRPSVKN